jgi:hypothetical protein
VRTGTALSAKKTTAGSTTVASKEERRSLNPKSKEWAGVYKDAKIAMGNMEPSEFTFTGLMLRTLGPR